MAAQATLVRRPCAVLAILGMPSLERLALPVPNKGAPQLASPEVQWWTAVHLQWQKRRP
jgi:hypothetical protein